MPALALIVALLSTFVAGCGLVARAVVHTAQSARYVGEPGRHGELTPQEKVWARTAWKYFENNTNARTGLVNSVDRYPSVTAWHIGDYLAALVAARELGLIDTRTFDLRVSGVLRFLGDMALSDGMLPNKVYQAATGIMTSFGSQPQDIGWSAVDIARLLVWLEITGQRYPTMREYVDKVVLRWSFCNVLTSAGGLQGRTRKANVSSDYPEGRLGYQQYGAAGFAVWGFDTRASTAMAPLEVVNIHGVRVSYDARPARPGDVQTPVLTTPFVLTGMEFGWRPPGFSAADAALLKSLAEQVYAVQAARFRETGTFTARTDHQLSQSPYFLYDAIFAAGYPWSTISDQGRSHAPLALVATRAVFGMWVLWPGSYTNALMKAVESLNDPARGWYEGRYERSGAPEKIITLSTNAMVLEALLFKARGTLYRQPAKKSYFDIAREDVFAAGNRCLPTLPPTGAERQRSP